MPRTAKTIELELAEDMLREDFFFHQGLKQAEKPKAKTKDDAEGSEKLDSTIKFQTTERNMPRSANIKISVAARPRKPRGSLCR